MKFKDDLATRIRFPYSYHLGHMRKGASTMSLLASKKYRDQIAVLLDRLGYAEDEDFVRNAGGLALSQVSHAIESAFATMGVIGVLCPRSSLASGHARSVPVVYLVSVRDRSEADARHRAIWSQSVTPIVLIAAPDFVQVRSGFNPRAIGPDISWGEIESDRLPEALVSLTSINVRSAASWQAFSVASRVDERISKSIEELSKDIRSKDLKLIDRADTINSAIGRFLYLYMLVDRGLLNQEWIDRLKYANGRPACPNIQLREGWGDGEARPTKWPLAEIWFLFDRIDAILNGSIFPISIGQRKLLDTESLHLIRRALRVDTIDDGEQQYGFLDINYASIRTETVSAIYECFFELEVDGGKAKQGAYYTPPFLVDYILDEVDSIEPLTPESRIVDPACGSGAFLVGAFRRIVERERRKGGELGPLRLREILETTVMGIEIKPQAVNVARFSLYLTMLDYLPGMTLASVPEAMSGARLFPDLRERLVTGDTFCTLPKAMRGTATHVLGNPPWTKIDKDNTTAIAYRTRLRALSCGDEVALMGKDGPMAEAFFWRAVRDICRPNGQIAFVMPTKSFIAPLAKWFPYALASRMTLNGITNLAHFREHLFTNARAAATVIFASSASASPLNRPWRYSPKPTSQPVGKDGTPWAIVVDRGQVEHFVQSDLLAREHKWFRDLMLQPLDRMIAAMLERRPASQNIKTPKSNTKHDSKDLLAETSLADGPITVNSLKIKPMLTLGGFLERNGMKILVGDTAERAQISADLVLNANSNDFRHRLGLIEGVEKNYELPHDVLAGLNERFRKLFRGPMILMTRNQSDLFIVDQSVAFSSSIQSIHFENEIVNFDLRLPVLKEIAAYLKTDVARYLLALFGRLWVFDQRRMETPDLNALPFPFLWVEDLVAAGPSSMTNPAFTHFCRKAFALDDDLFELAVAEHHDLREAYQDGRRPSIAYDRPQKSVKADYVKILEKHVADLLSGSLVDVISINEDAGRQRTIRIMISLDGQMPSDGVPPHIGRDLSPEAGIYVTTVDHTLVVDVIKPDMRSAFTVERAYADALSVAERIMTV
ncbi:N-6 DNA methylase [Methylobacterium sp. E-045]|uniref:N-6 DNA methylase n=1 Tax=Methylobacterium sp. E-045 TaxID=2836575 RepID=UPI001FBB6367|nr:N-6 DNA methylase [Methylobacterium sp. E-045]MCJ2130535.1 N-6 DNA methylase [Methylobacterium sp. E-045]